MVRRVSKENTKAVLDRKQRGETAVTKPDGRMLCQEIMEEVHSNGRSAFQRTGMAVC